MMNKKQYDPNKYKSKIELACLGFVIEVILHEMPDRSPQKS